MHLNARTMSVTKKGDLRSYGTVWYNPNMEETTHMLSEGEIAELIIKLVLTMYRKHIQESKKESICYCQTHYNSGA